MPKEKKPIIEMADGVKRQGDSIFVPNSHKKFPGLRGDQAFGIVMGGMDGGFVLRIKDLDNSQRGALGLPRKGEGEQ